MSDTRPRGGAGAEPETEPEADPRLEELETLLAPYRWRGALPPAEALPERPPRRRLPRALPFVAAAAALALAVTLVLARRDAPPRATAAYRYEVLAGAPRVEGPGKGTQEDDTGQVSAGQRVVCDEATRVALAIGAIGRVELGPRSSLRVEDPADAGDPLARHLLFLERGALRASILAAPRLFQVGTPAGIAVDLGCEYEAAVADDGSTRLSVRTGQVAFESDGRRVIVPAGASTRAFPGAGPATPVWDDAGAEFRARLLAFDREGRRADLDAALALARPEDGLSLWHLLGHPREAARAPAFDRLAALHPPPPGVTRAGVLAGRHRELELYKRALGWSW